MTDHFKVDRQERLDWAQDVAGRIAARVREYTARPAPDTLIRTRRGFLQLLGAGTAGAAALSLLGACGDDGTTAAGGSGTPGVPNGAGRTLTVSVWGGETEGAFRDTVVPVFTRLTGAKVQFEVGGAGERFNKLLAQKAAPTVDVFINSGENIYQAHRQNLLADLDPGQVPNLADIHDWAKPFGYGVSYGLLAFGLTYVAGITPPSRWQDLWRDDLRGRLSLPAVGHSTMPQFLIIAAELHGGSADNIGPGLDALGRLDPHTLHVFWAEWAPAVKARAVVVAPEINYQVLTMQDEGLDVSFVYPKERAVAGDNTMSVVAGTDNSDLAHAFINVTLDPEVQGQFCAIWHGSPTNKRATLPASIADRVPLATDILDKVRFFDYAAIAGKRAEWTEQLNTRVLPKWR